MQQSNQGCLGFCQMNQNKESHYKCINIYPTDYPQFIAKRIPTHDDDLQCLPGIWLFTPPISNPKPTELSFVSVDNFVIFESADWDFAADDAQCAECETICPVTQMSDEQDDDDTHTHSISQSKSCSSRARWSGVAEISSTFSSAAHLFPVVRTIRSKWGRGWGRQAGSRWC